MLKELHRAVSRQVISKPQLQELPRNTPFYAALCVIDLAIDCEPPISGVPRRLATGYSRHPDTAHFLALAEAAERYSLQYSSVRPTILKSFNTSENSARSMSIERLTIGAPGTNGQINSQGCAAGVDLEDASSRAVLELLEHLIIEEILAGKRACSALPPDSSATSSLDAWLKGQFRQLNHLVHASDAGYFVVVSRCSDFDGGRPCHGSAAATSLENAVLNSSLEAIFHWRNMVEIERRGTQFERLRNEEELALLEYRGARPRRDWPVAQPLPQTDSEAYELDLGELVKELSSLSGSEVLLFDLTVDELEVPVVRAVLD